MNNSRPPARSANRRHFGSLHTSPGSFPRLLSTFCPLLEVAERGLGVGPDPLSAALSILLWPSPASIRPRYTALSSRGADACPSSPLGGLGRVGCPFRICHVRHVSPASQGVVAFS